MGRISHVARLHDCLRIQRNAWFDTGYMYCVREVQWEFRAHSSSCGATVMSFTIPLNFCTIFATATVVTSCSSQIALALRPQCAAGVFASRCRVVVEVSLLMVLTFLRWTALCRRREIHYQFLPVPRCCLVCLHAQGLDQQLLRFLRRQPQLLPVQFEGHGSQCSLCSYTGAGLWGDS